jgi:hypothetical protein
VRLTRRRTSSSNFFDEILTRQGHARHHRTTPLLKSDGALNDSIFKGEDDFRFGYFVA